jgi:hypothetical protein
MPALRDFSFKAMAPLRHVELVSLGDVAPEVRACGSFGRLRPG